MAGKPIEKGSFVSLEAHPEYGVGRVLKVDTFATRVLFPKGGVRVYRAGDMARLKSVAAPVGPELDTLVKLEEDLEKGIAMVVPREKPEPKKPRAAKKAGAAP
jgi:hypothetical protein